MTYVCSNDSDHLDAWNATCLQRHIHSAHHPQLGHALHRLGHRNALVLSMHAPLHADYMTWRNNEHPED